LEQGGEPELHALIESHLPLVRQVVFQVAANFPRHVDRDELATAGALGLVEAARRFDPDRGVLFGQFAARRIRGAILDSARAADWAPRSVRTLARRVDAAEQRLATKLGRTATIEETAIDLGMARETLARVRDNVFRSAVLALEYEVRDGDEDLTIVDVLADQTTQEPSDQLESRELESYMRDAVRLLPERHRLVIVGYFLEARPSSELAELLEVTESRVSQLRAEALVMLREGISAQFESPDAEPAKPGRVSRRKAGYAEAISCSRAWHDRLDERPGP
jgi:RNA polymerase sigma factor for flagellar operon FliA